jgi:hypothetical protein
MLCNLVYVCYSNTMREVLICTRCYCFALLLRWDLCQAYMRSRNADAVSIARWIINPVTADVSHS